MKRIVLSFFAIAAISLSASAQCVPDTSITHNDPGVYPDSATNLPHAFVGSPYSTTIQMKVLLDTIVVIFGQNVPVTIDDVTINTVTGLPPGYTYSCTPANCVFPGGSDGCILIQGPAPTQAQIGMVYQIHVEATATGHITGTGTSVPPETQSIDYYFIQVDDNTSIFHPSGNKFEVSQNTPNPFSGLSVVEYNSPAGGLTTIKVSNMLGEEVNNKVIMAKAGINKIMFNAKDFEAGIYFYTISSEKNSVTRRMIVDHD
jgi:hypothetical protein